MTPSLFRPLVSLLHSPFLNLYRGSGLHRATALSDAKVLLASWRTPYITPFSPHLICPGAIHLSVQHMAVPVSTKALASDPLLPRAAATQKHIFDGHRLAVDRVG